MSKVPATANKDAWWKGVSRFQWIVLLVASLGWIIDTFEGQIFVTAMLDLARVRTNERGEAAL